MFQLHYSYRSFLSSRCVKSKPSPNTPRVTIANVNTFVPGSRWPPNAFAALVIVQMRVNVAINHTAIHAHDIGGRDWIHQVSVLGWERAVADRMRVVAPYRPGPSQNHR